MEVIEKNCRLMEITVEYCWNIIFALPQGSAPNSLYTGDVGKFIFFRC